MMFSLFLSLSYFIAMGSMNSIKPESSEEVVPEGGNIKLSCKYEGSIYNIQWYKQQHQRSRPEFLLLISEDGSISPEISGINCEELTPVKTEEFTSEHTSASLSYKYHKSAAANDYFFWYRQHPGKPPEFLMSHSGTGTTLSVPVSGLSVTEVKAESA
ncbi:T cell receptor alpha chain [Solea senegalensis]|nr:T cell receptor alpha chain [Solea senegalensis]